MGSLAALAGRIARYEEKEALEALRAMLLSGADTRVLIGELADIFRRMMWIGAGAAPEEADAALAPLAKSYGKAACVRALDILLRKEYEMRQNLRADIVFETAVMAMMAPEDDGSAPDSVRIEKLEARLAALEARASATPIAVADTVSTRPAEKKAEKPKAEKPLAAPRPQDMEAAALWQKALQKLKNDNYMNYSHASRATGVSLAGDRLEVLFENYEVSAEYLKQNAAQALADAVQAAAGRPLAVSVVYRKRETAGASPANQYEVEEI
jgi:DNA polymerase III gamma/tau subunit